MDWTPEDLAKNCILEVLDKMLQNIKSELALYEALMQEDPDDATADMVRYYRRRKSNLDAALQIKLNRR